MQTSRTHSAAYLRTHFGLLWRVSVTELRGRYAGSILGVGWAVVTPLLTLAIYAAVYSLVFRVSVPGLGRAEYVLYIFSGLVPFLMTSEALAAGTQSVASSRAVWTNTVFPVELAPVKAVLISQVPMLVGMVIVLVGALAVGRLAWTVLLLPFIWVLHCLALLGILWPLSLANLVVRDLQSLVGLLILLLLIASPIAYTPEMVPDSLRPLLFLNPLAYFVRSYQQVLVLGEVPGLGTGLPVVLGSVFFFGMGGMIFARTKGALLDYV